MNNKYFNNISKLEELRKQCKELLKLHHPDNGGEMLNKIIHFDNIDIELVGAWIWVSGNTYACKKELSLLRKIAPHS